MGLLSSLQKKNKEGGGRGIVPNYLVNKLSALIHSRFIEPGLQDQHGQMRNEIIKRALKNRSLLAGTKSTVAPPAPEPPPPAPAPAVDEFSNLRQFRTKSNQPVDGALARLVAEIAKRYSIEPKLAGALAIQESDWNPKAVGGTTPPGYGLFQLTPKANPGRWDETRLNDPEYNANEGLGMIAQGLADADKLGFTGTKRIRHALRRYNGGPQYWANVPGFGGRTRNQNTATYADNVMSWYNQ